MSASLFVRVKKVIYENTAVYSIKTPNSKQMIQIKRKNGKRFIITII